MIEYIMNALKLIDHHYYEVFGMGSDDETYQQAAENAFTAELYHQLNTTQPEVNSNAKGLSSHFDLNKTRANNIRPDLVLHKAPYNRSDQRVYLEVKTNGRTASECLINDIGKILNAVKQDNGREYLGYEFGIFVAGNIIYQRLQGKFRDVFLNQPDNIKSKIHIITFTSYPYAPSYYDSQAIFFET